MQHEPVGDDDHSGEQAEISYWAEVDAESHTGKYTQITQRSDCDADSDFAETTANPTRDRVRERD